MRRKSFPKGTVKRAFSLVEIATVLAIMGVMLAIATPRFADFVQRDRVRRSARKVATDVRYAQSLAIRDRSPVTMMFSEGLDAYSIWLKDTTAKTETWMVVRLSNRKVEVLANRTDRATYEQIVDLAGDPDYGVALVNADFGGKMDLTFDEYGTPTGAIGGIVQLGLNTYRINISVDGVTGRVGVGELTEHATAVALPADRSNTAIIKLPNPVHRRNTPDPTPAGLALMASEKEEND